MNNLRLPTQDSSTGRALKTVAFAIGGFAIGLAVTIWAVPGVPAAAILFIRNNLAITLLAAGVPAGILNFVWNVVFRKSVPNY